MKSLEKFTRDQTMAQLKEELRLCRNSEASLRWYVKTQMRPLMSMGLKQGGEIQTLQRRIKRLTIDPEKVVQKMRGHSVWSDYCFDEDDFQAGREITLAVLKAAGVKL